MSKEQNPDDVARYEYFQKWVKEQAELKGWDMRSGKDRQVMADNYNATLEPGQKEITESAFRRLVSRGTAVNDTAIGTVTRGTCRLVANGLLLDRNDVLEAAGYQREDRHSQIDDLPGGIRAKYGMLSDRYKQRVHDCIVEMWEEQANDSSEK